MPDSLPPSPPRPDHSPEPNALPPASPTYNLYHKFFSQSDPHQANHPVTHPATPDSSSSFDPSAVLFPTNGQESVLSPQEREIMADITLDPDDPATWATAENDASLLKNDATANILHSRSPPVTAASQHLVPAPPVIVPATSTSISPSPFAPPAPTAGPSAVSSPPSLSHETAEAQDAGLVQSHMSATTSAVLVERARGEYVMEHKSPSPSLREDGQAGLDNPSPRDGDGQSAPPHVVDPSPSQQEQSLPPPLDTTRLPSSSKTPLFLPSPSDSLPTTRTPSDPSPPAQDKDAEPPDIISIHSSASPSLSRQPSHPPISTNTKPRAKPKRQRLLMEYVLLPPPPSRVRKSDRMPAEQGSSMRKRLSTAKGKARAGDNSGPTALAAALQGAFESNSSSTLSVQTSGAKRKPVQREARPVEPVEVVDDEDELEGEAQNQGSNTLARALSDAFAHNSADPNVVGPPASGPSGSTRRRRRVSPVVIDSDTPSVGPRPSTPVKRSRAQRHARADSDYNVPSSSAVATRRRSDKRQPQTPTSPQRKRRRLTRRRDDADEHEAQEDGEIEIVDSPPLEPRRSLRAKPHSSKPSPKRDSSRPKVGRPRQQRRALMLSLISISASTSSHSPSPSPPPLAPPQSPSVPSPDSNTLSDQPLTILPQPAHADIVIPARALNHLHSLPRPPDDLESQPGVDGGGAEGSETRTQLETLQGFRGEEAAVGAHGLLESPTTVAATIAAADTMGDTTAPQNSGACANTTGLQNRSLDLGMDAIVPMVMDDGGQELVQERHDVVRATVVPSHALRIFSTTHPEGPMLGFVLSEREDAVHGSLSADPDTEASSNGVGLELDANTGPESEFMLGTLNPGFDAGARWSDWDVSGPSTGEGEYIGDGTIDPSVLGGCGVNTSLTAGSPGKVLRSDTAVSDDNSSPLRGSMSMRTIDKNKSLDDNIIPPSSVGGTGHEDRDKVVASARRIVVNGKQKRRKSWRKALADENQSHKDTDTDNTDTEDDRNVDGVRPTLSSLSSLLNAERTFCHHCRRKTCRPKMRCTLIRKNTGIPCGKMYCDLCIERRYPSLTFDEFATVFVCPCCRDFCNCTQCARARGEEYVPERNGGWRKWVADAAAMGAAGSTPPLSPRRRGAVSMPVPALDKWNTTVFTVTGEPMGEVYLDGNKTRVVPIQPAGPSHTTRTSTFRLSPPAPSATTTAKPKKRRYVYIGKRRKAWGRLVSVPDPEEQLQKKGKTLRCMGRGRGKRGRAVRVRLFAGSEEPLSSARKRRERRNQRDLSVPLLPSSPVRKDGIPNSDENVDVDADADEGVWPGEIVVPPGVLAVETAVEDKVDDFGSVWITPEVLERAIGAAFAVGVQ
ncbi:hypothetical protein BC827DRAFT_1193088 [Russula dissimulans]|nr:hypothetical protein BC827DRAFT_1193088 [Russula dissimulans]